VAGQNAGAQRASAFVAQSDAYFRQGNVLGSRHLQQMQGIQESAYHSFANGVARGEASYLNGVNNRVFTGLDVRSDVFAQAAYDSSIWSQGRQNAQDFSDDPYVVSTIGALQTVEGAVLTGTGITLSATGLRSLYRHIWTLP
jgi:hypothetical protein